MISRRSLSPPQFLWRHLHFQNRSPKPFHLQNPRHLTSKRAIPKPTTSHRPTYPLLCYNKIMRESFYFYDLETSGLNSRTDRIMQFAGQRTDLDFRPLGEPTNLLIELANDTLPSPQATMVTGITPQATHQDGISERDFCRFIIEEVATPGTIIVGYNSVRFDDEFIRNALWRNFYDAYEWQWKDRRSRWDLLDVVRLTRALRPEGINWPVKDDGVSTNRLELITKCNDISHEHAHDALADVVALIEVTKLIKQKQPQLYNYLFNLRGKRAIHKLINLKDPKPFVYASGRYGAENEKTTVAYPIAEARNGNILVYDLRFNLEDLLAAEADGTYEEKFGRKWRVGQDIKPEDRDFFPIVKTLQYNHCPAVAPLGVLDKADGWQKIKLDKSEVEHNLAVLRAHPDFVTRVQETLAKKPEFPPAIDAESALYDGFLDDKDKLTCMAMRNNTAEDLRHFRPKVTDARLPELILHYKAKNFPSSLDETESAQWEEYRCARLKRQAPKFLAELAAIEKSLSSGKGYGNKTSAETEFLLEELKLWYQSLQPEDY